MCIYGLAVDPATVCYYLTLYSIRDNMLCYYILLVVGVGPQDRQGVDIVNEIHSIFFLVGTLKGYLKTSTAKRIVKNPILNHKYNKSHDSIIKPLYRRHCIETKSEDNTLLVPLEYSV